MFYIYRGASSGSHWSISPSSKNFGPQNREFCDPIEGQSKTLKPQHVLNKGKYYEISPFSRRHKDAVGLTNGVGSNSSIDLEWETAEGMLSLLFNRIARIGNKMAVGLFCHF